MAYRMATQVTISARLRGAIQRTDLDQADVAPLVGANPRTVSRWLAEQSQPRTEARRRLLEILAVLESLSSVLQPQAAHDWLYTPNQLVEHRKPIELLEAGDWRTVLGLIDALAEGVFV
jgi:putative toxin-antitoxin system antitoxin component (TIGR02293 family)